MHHVFDPIEDFIFFPVIPASGRYLNHLIFRSTPLGSSALSAALAGGEDDPLPPLAAHMSTQKSIIASVRCDYCPLRAGGGRRSRAVVRRMVAPFDRLGTGDGRPAENGHAGDAGDIRRSAERYQQADGYIIDELLEREAQKLGWTLPVCTSPSPRSAAGGRATRMLAASFAQEQLPAHRRADQTISTGRRERRSPPIFQARRGLSAHLSRPRFFSTAVSTTSLSPQSGRRGNPAREFSTLAGKRGKREINLNWTRHEKLNREVGRLAQAAAAPPAGRKRILGVLRSAKSTPPTAGFIAHKSAKMMKRAKADLSSAGRSALEERRLLCFQNLSDRATQNDRAPKVPGVCWSRRGSCLFPMANLAFSLKTSATVAPGTR